MTPREELLEMLRYMRPARSKAERKFINRFLLPLPGATTDEVGNVIVRVGTSPVLWSSHTDTVHMRSGKQEVYLDADDYAFVKHSDCLGADCTTGVWLMVNMIRAGVPGLYVFHRDEEIGGRGSDHIAKNTPELLAGINIAIAFDRKRTDSIVTHQFGQRCCSDAFGTSLTNLLGGGFKLDDTGTFTDTANYTDLIAECTNISVGYYDQHTSMEVQDIQFAEALLDVLIHSDFSGLVVQRAPGEIDPRAGRSSWFRKYSTFAATSATDDDNYDRWMDEVPFSSPDADECPSDHLKTLVLDHPDIVAAILKEYGVAPDEILSRAYAHH